MASLEKSELPVFLGGSCGPQEYSEDGSHRRNGGENVGTAVGGPEDPWPYCLYYGLCDLGQVISPLCASVSSTVNGDL